MLIFFFPFISDKYRTVEVHSKIVVVVVVFIIIFIRRAEIFKFKTIMHGWIYIACRTSVIETVIITIIVIIIMIIIYFFSLQSAGHARKETKKM